MAEVTVSISAAPIAVTVSSAQGPAGSGSGATVVDAVTNGEANAVSSNAVFDALALKAPLISPSFTTPALGVATATSIAATTFTGALVGNATTSSSTTGNAATVTTNANLTGPVTSTGNATAIANGAISNAMLANAAVTNLSGTNTGDETAARIATALNAGTEDTTAADTDKLGVTHPAGGWMLLSTLWTWIKAKIDAGMTIAGAQTFSGQVQLAAGQAATDSQSAMSRGLGDARYGGELLRAHLLSEVVATSLLTWTNTATLFLPQGTYEFELYASGLNSTNALTVVGFNLGISSSNSSDVTHGVNIANANASAVGVAVGVNMGLRSQTGALGATFYFASSYAEFGANRNGSATARGITVIPSGGSTVNLRIIQRGGLATSLTASQNGLSYTIATVGTTDFTLLGAASNTVGVTFVKSGATGLGTGTVTDNNHQPRMLPGSYMKFTKLA